MILRRPRASADLSDIWEFIAEDSMDRADQFIDRIDAKFRALADQPQMGRARDEVAPGLRSFPVPPYVIFYGTWEGNLPIECPHWGPSNGCDFPSAERSYRPPFHEPEIQRRG